MSNPNEWLLLGEWLGWLYSLWAGLATWIKPLGPVALGTVVALGALWMLAYYALNLDRFGRPKLAVTLGLAAPLALVLLVVGLWDFGLGPWRWRLGLLALLGLGLILMHFFQRVVTKVAAVAWTTAKDSMSQPLFWVLLALGATAMILFPFVPHFTFGEDIKTLIKLLAIVLAVWSASVSIADEIEGRTALTLLSKPLGRLQLLLGKFIGILVPVAVMFIVLGALFLAAVSYKVVYDARETANPDPTWEQCRDEMVQVTPGLALSFFEATVLTSVAVAISTRLPMLANLLCCAAIYALGHLLPLLVDITADRLEYIGFVGRLLATLLPVLEYFSMETAISTGQAVPLAYVGAAALYCALYSGLALTVALFSFEDRDLA